MGPRIILVKNTNNQHLFIPCNLFNTVKYFSFLKYSIFWGRPLQFKRISFQTLIRHELNTFMYNMLQNEVEMVTEDVQKSKTI